MYAVGSCKIVENETDVYRLKGESNRTAAKDCLGVMSSESVLNTAHVARANIGVH